MRPTDNSSCIGNEVWPRLTKMRPMTFSGNLFFRRYKYRVPQYFLFFPSLQVTQSGSSITFSAPDTLAPGEMVQCILRISYSGYVVSTSFDDMPRAMAVSSPQYLEPTFSGDFSLRKAHTVSTPYIFGVLKVKSEVHFSEGYWSHKICKMWLKSVSRSSS